MKKLLLLTALAVCLTACSKISIDSSDEVIRFNIVHPSSVVKATSTAFVAGDTISLFAVESPNILQRTGNFINNEKLTYTGNSWTAEHSLYWKDTACDFYGFYPYQPSFLSIEYFPFSVSLDQNNGGFEKSDLMFAYAEGVSKDDGAVNLQFHHMMSKLVVKLKKGDKFEGEIPEDAVAHVYNTTSSCVVDWSKGSVEKDVFGNKRTITMKKISDTQYEAIVVPQNLEKKTPLVELTMGGIAYLLEYSLSLKAGCVHTITVTLNTSPDQEMIEISIDPSREDWN